MSKDGRVVAKRTGIGSGDADTQAAIWAEMVRLYRMESGLVVNGLIWPALEIMVCEHRLLAWISTAYRSPNTGLVY
jgi:hypothetical protein